ncbi:MAG: hypothetical protein LUB59_06670 [Candidatus Gastranaerophilales bacterium]|nr:hypothetical protein [Candidatus Gastranaerophilales bacterium]
MKKKCTKFETLFTFCDEKTLTEHVNQCEDCRREYEKMNKVSALIQEVKPHYKQNKYYAVRVACLLFAFIIGGVTFQIADMNYGLVDTIKYGQRFTAEDLGFQTDEYGLLMVGDE